MESGCSRRDDQCGEQPGGQPDRSSNSPPSFVHASILARPWRCATYEDARRDVSVSADAGATLDTSISGRGGVTILENWTFMVSDDQLAGRLRDLERTVMARLAEQEQQLRDLRERSMPDRGIKRLGFRVVRKAKRIPASLRRRVRAARRARRLANERQVVPAAEAARRAKIVDGYLEPTVASGPAETSMP